MIDITEFGSELSKTLESSLEKGERNALTRDFQMQIDLAKQCGNNERESYYKSRIEQLSLEKTEISDVDRLNHKINEYHKQLDEAKASGNMERYNYYENKLKRANKDINFGTITLYERQKRAQAQEKYDQEKKVTKRERKKYEDTHPHLTSHQIKKLNELSKK